MRLFQEVFNRHAAPPAQMVLAPRGVEDFVGQADDPQPAAGGLCGYKLGNDAAQPALLVFLYGHDSAGAPGRGEDGLRVERLQHR